jgi:hypothetical protein
VKAAFATLALSALTALLAAPAAAHDTWFEPQAAPARGEAQFALGTGTRFPTFELAVDVQYFSASGCRVGDGPARRFSAHRFTDTFTQLRVTAPEPARLSCWVQIVPFEIELPPDRLEVYFAEIRPRPEVLAAWQALRARGLPFRERYVKSARFDAPEAAPLSSGTALDVLRVAPAGALRAGAEATFRLLRDGRPLPDQALELVPARGAGGQWARTDAQGELRVRLTQPGRWLLRGTDLRVAPDDPERFASQFITYAFEVAPP